MVTVFRKTPILLSYYFVGQGKDQTMFLGNEEWQFWLLSAFDWALLTAGGWTLQFAVAVVSEGALTMAWRQQ